MSDLQAFTFFKQDAGMTVAIDPIGPILGSGSLLLGPNGTAGRRINGIRANTPNSFTSGRARLLLEPVVIGTTEQIGFAFQLSQADLTGGSGLAYAFLLVHSVSSTWLPRIYKMTAGVATSTLLATGTSRTVPINTTLAVEVQWILDIPNLGGIQITIKLGTATDYSDLVLDAALNILITSSVLTTSVGEGPCLNTNAGTGSYRYDHFEVIPLLVG